jgi:uncharacterized integral membrane protein
MKKVKIVFGFLVVGVIVLVIAQNLDFFLQRHVIGINIGLASYHTPEWATIIYLLFFFFAGLLIAFLMGLSERFRSKKTIRELNDMIAVEKKKKGELEAELASAKAAWAQNTQADGQKQPDAVTS